MAFQYLNNVPLQQAKDDYLNALRAAGFSSRIETVPVFQALNRITSAPVYAHISAPHYPASAMDGIAVIARDTFGATETTAVTLSADQYLTVDTGDMIPEQFDAVIMVEDIVRQEDDSVVIHAPASPWQHIRQIGEDICAGEMILPSYMKVTPSAIGALIAGGVMEISVLAKPVIGIIPTGDEIVAPTADPKPGDILEFNSSIFSSMLTQWGAVPKTYPIVPDKFDQLKAMLAKALEECDIVILNAGSSAGREDFSAEIIRQLGTVLYHGIAIKPGKPAILGYQNNKPILGVPGYPVSGILVLEQFMRPLISEWNHFYLEKKASKKAILSRRIVSGLKYEEFIRVRLGHVGDKLIASPLNRGSGVVSSFMKADGIVTIPQGTEGFEAGDIVDVQLLRPDQELDNMLVAIGSHDPLLDELADLIHMDKKDMYMSSTHVGSMGGIMAVRRGETHAAGIHLLNEQDGSYNTAFIRKYFPHGGVRLVECVERTQGLMIQKGNPKNIQGIQDLTRDGIRYINRQKGSGTRILIDYLCKEEHIDPKQIYGYDREEFTHNSVAIQIATGSGDVGMGIYSASKLYDLDFLPICMEQYDLLIPDEVWDTPVVQELISILKSDEFRSRIEALGGYRLTNPGEVREHF